MQAYTRGCCVPPKKKGEEARGFSTVRGAPQNGDGQVEADFAIMRLTAQNAENAQKKKEERAT